MKYLILVIMIFSISIFGLKIEDNTNNTETKVQSSSPVKEVKKESGKTEKKLENKKPKVEENTPVSQEEYINLGADEAGRVFIIPGIDFAPSFSSKVDNLFLISSDIEYLTEHLNNKLSVYGNIGFGLTGDFFLLHLEAGTKYNLERMTRFMKPFLKLGLTLNPYFTSSVVYTPFAVTGGLGFKFFINSNIALEQTNELQLGGQLNDSTFYMSMRFRISAVMVF